MDTRVAASLTATVQAPAAVELQVAVAGDRVSEEELVVTLDGAPVRLDEHRTEAAGRLQLLTVGPAPCPTTTSTGESRWPEPTAPGTRVSPACPPAPTRP